MSIEYGGGLSGFLGDRDGDVEVEDTVMSQNGYMTFVFLGNHLDASDAEAVVELITLCRPGQAVGEIQFALIIVSR